MLEARDGAVPALLVTGTIGTGKSVVAAEVGELLAGSGVVTAVVDLDWLGWVCRPRRHAGEPGAVHELIVRNLHALWPNLRDAGAERLVLARAVTARAEVDALRHAIPGGELVVVRLTATAATVRTRLEARDSGAVLAHHLEESATFDRLLDDARIADASVPTDDRSVRDVAHDVLVAARWTDEYTSTP